MANLKRGLIAQNDLMRHRPEDGTAVQDFDRTSSTGGLVAPKPTKISAASIPLLDPVTVADAQTPFEFLADTQAAKTVEAALADIRKNIPHYKNFEYYGGIPGAASATQAAKNTEVLNKIVTDLTAEGRLSTGIFFPGYGYEFAEFGGIMPTFTGKPALVFCGLPGTLLSRHSSASTGLSLLNFADCSDVRIIDLSIDRVGTAGAGHCVVFTAPNSVDFGNLYILNCKFFNGLSNVLLAGTAGHIASNVWVSGNKFNGAGGANLAMSAVSGVHILNNNFVTSGTGISVTSPGGVTANLDDIEIIGNILSGTGQTISVIRSGVYSSVHRGLTVSRNKIKNGNLVIQGVNEVECASNTLQAGAIQLTFDMTIANRLKLIDNDISFATGIGLSLVGTGCTLTGFQIRGGTISNCTQQGIRLSFATAPAKGGVISGVSIIDCSRENSAGTDYSGILLNAPDATGGVQDTIVADNIIRCYTDTGAPNFNKHLFGVEEAGAGANARNMIGPNFIQGYVTADVSGLVATSLDVVAAVTAVVATYTRFDGGPAV